MPATSRRGFTLLEVLIALVIAAIGLGVLFQGSLVGIRAADLSGRTEEAVSRARSRLAVVANATVLAPEDRNGDDGGGYRWRVRVVPLAVRQDGPGLPGSALYQVSVAVSWGVGRNAQSVTLETKRLAALAPP